LFGDVLQSVNEKIVESIGNFCRRARVEASVSGLADGPDIALHPVAKADGAGKRTLFGGQGQLEARGRFVR
jgi:hypothetical protein